MNAFSVVALYLKDKSSWCFHQSVPQLIMITTAYLLISHLSGILFYSYLFRETLLFRKLVSYLLSSLTQYIHNLHWIVILINIKVVSYTSCYYAFSNQMCCCQSSLSFLSLKPEAGEFISQTQGQ